MVFHGNTCNCNGLPLLNATVVYVQIGAKSTQLINFQQKVICFLFLQEPDSGYKSPTKYDKDEVVRKMEEEDDEKIEEMIDDISTNEMFGSSILSMEN